jgi:hypothetical protein
MMKDTRSLSVDGAKLVKKKLYVGTPLFSLKQL